VQSGQISQTASRQHPYHEPEIILRRQNGKPEAHGRNIAITAYAESSL
jgi:hypothetical protein